MVVEIDAAMAVFVEQYAEYMKPQQAQGS